MICANCRNHAQIDGDSVYQADQRDANLTTDWRLHRARNYFVPPAEQINPSDRQPPSQETGLIVPHKDRLDLPNLEQCKPEHSANKVSTEKRKRKPRTIKPRKPRTLTEEGKAHAKAIREYPGGACQDCKQKKTKARDPQVIILGSTHL